MLRGFVASEQGWRKLLCVYHVGELGNKLGGTESVWKSAVHLEELTTKPKTSGQV